MKQKELAKVIWSLRKGYTNLALGKKNEDLLSAPVKPFL